jgi:FkbM family methyltransferase
MAGPVPNLDGRSDIRKRFGRLKMRLADRLAASRKGVGFNAPYLSRICQPATVIDVGVGYGTWPLHKAYPTARFILIEPLTEYRSYLARLSRAYDCTVIQAAVGERPGQCHMMVDTGCPMRSSLSTRTPVTRSGSPLSRRTVNVVTLDSLLDTHPDLRRPILLKIDTEGHELAVLRGAQALLPLVDTVIAEVSIAPRFDQGYSFEEFVSYMDAHGFNVYSFLTMPVPRRSDRQRFTDMVFKNVASTAS